MAIKKKGNSWYVQVYAGMVNGKQEYISAGGFDKKKDALEEEARIKKGIYKRDHVVRGAKSFYDTAELYTTLRESKVTAATLRSEKDLLSRNILPFFERKLVSEIERVDIMKFLAKLEGKYKAETTIKIIGILRRILDFSVECDLIEFNPCSGIKLPKIERSKKVTWNENEIYEFLNLEDTKNESCYAAFLILFTTGMRPGEVCGLRWCDWNGDHLTPTYGIGTKKELTDLKNGKAHENVFIDKYLEAYLKRLKIAQRELYFAEGLQLTNDCFINVLPPDMRCITVNYLRKRFDILVKKNTLKKIRLYDARHSLGTNMMRAGVNPKEVAEVMRHTSVKTTLDIYSHVDDDEKKSVMDKYSSRIFKRGY